MPNRSCVLIATDAAKAGVNAVLEAMDLGPDSIAQPAAPTAAGPPTHWFGHAFAEQAIADAWLAYAEGTLPAVQLPWGLFGAPSEADALAASSGFTVSVSAGEAIPTEHLSGILAGMGLVPVTG